MLEVNVPVNASAERGNVDNHMPMRTPEEIADNIGLKLWKNHNELLKIGGGQLKASELLHCEWHEQLIKIIRTERSQADKLKVENGRLGEALNKYDQALVMAISIIKCGEKISDQSASVFMEAMKSKESKPSPNTLWDAVMGMRNAFDEIRQVCNRQIESGDAFLVDEIAEKATIQFDKEVGRG